MAWCLGIVHIVNLAHGEFMMVAAYSPTFAARALGLRPLHRLHPVALVMAAFGLVVYLVAAQEPR